MQETQPLKQGVLGFCGFGANSGQLAVLGSLHFFPAELYKYPKRHFSAQARPAKPRAKVADGRDMGRAHAERRDGRGGREGRQSEGNNLMIDRKLE